MAYSKQTWVRGEKVASVKLNHMEDGIYENSVTLEHGIEAAVDNWLDEHPEATTTVQDGSLTEAKFSNALKLKTIKDYVTPEMFGAKGDGVTDDTDAINQALTYGNVQLGNGKTYLVSETNGDTLIFGSNTILDMNGATIQLAKNTRSAYSVFRLNNVENVKISNGTIKGDRGYHSEQGAWQYGHVVFIAGCSNITLSNMTISDGRGDGVYIGVSSLNAESENIYIHNCVIDNNYRNGMSIASCNNGIIENCTFKNTNGSSPQSGFDIEPNADHTINVAMENIVCENNIVGFCIVNNFSTDYKVHIGHIQTDNGPFVNCAFPSIVDIDSIAQHIETQNSVAFDFSVSNDSFVNIWNYSIISDENIANVIATESGINNLFIGALRIVAPSLTAFASNSSAISLRIGTLIFDAEMAYRTILNTNIIIDKICKAKKTITENQTLKMFDNDLVFVNSGGGLLTVNIAKECFTDGSIVCAYNNSESGTGNARFATADGTQSIVNGTTTSNTVQIPSGQFIKMQYIKPAGKWFVLYLG